MKKALFLIMMILFLIPITNGILNVTPSEKGTTYIKWNWSETYLVNNISVDGYKVWGFDNSTTNFILSDLKENSTHQIRIYNITDSGFNITTTLDIKESGTNTFFNTINGYVFLIFVVIFLIIGAYIPFAAFGAIIFSIWGLINAVGNSFLMGLLFFILLVAAIIELRFG